MLADFYRDILPSEGQYVLFSGRRKHHTWCSSIDELTRQTEERSTEIDLYFGVSSFREPTSRTADNALYSWAFYFHIDAGPE